MSRKREESQPRSEERSAAPKDWPGIQGRSKGHEEAPETGTQREDQAKVTDAQRELED